MVTMSSLWSLLTKQKPNVFIIFLQSPLKTFNLYQIGGMETAPKTKRSQQINSKLGSEKAGFWNVFQSV